MGTQVAIKEFLKLGENPEVKVLARFLELMYCPIVKSWYSKRKVQRQHSPFLISALHGRERPASRPGRFIPGEEERQGTHGIDGWAGPTAGLNVLEKRKNHDSSVVLPVAKVALLYPLQYSTSAFNYRTVLLFSPEDKCRYLTRVELLRQNPYRWSPTISWNTRLTFKNLASHI